MYMISNSQGCRGSGISIPIPIPQDFCGNSHMGPHIDSHMGFHKGKMIPIPVGHGKLGIPMTNLVIVARTTFMLEGACSQLTN